VNIIRVQNVAILQVCRVVIVFMMLFHAWKWNTSLLSRWGYCRTYCSYRFNSNIQKSLLSTV